MGSFPARRLARTEISRAHSAATVESAALDPFVVGIRWTRSARHPEEDECDERATADVGLGEGVYPVDEVPKHPAHPMCLCVLSKEMTEDADAVVDALREQYGLDRPRTAEEEAFRREIAGQFDEGAAVAEAEAIVDAAKPTAPTFRTTAEAEEYARDTFARTVDYAGMPVEMANRINQALAENFARYTPVNQGKMRVLGVGRVGRALARANQNGILFSPGNIKKSFSTNLTERYAGVGPGKPRRWTVQNDDVERLVTHEFAHVIDFQQGIGDDGFDTARRVRRVFDRKMTKAEQAAFLENFSEYGTTNQAEFWAELYTMWVYEPHLVPKVLADAVEDALDRARRSRR